MVLALAGCVQAASTPGATPAGAATTAWQLEVEAPGPYWLDPSWFRAQGIDPQSLAGRLRLQRAQEQVLFLLIGGPEGAGLFFYAAHAPSRFAPWTTYRLDLSHGAGSQMSTGSLPDATPAAFQSSDWTTGWQEQDRQYRPQIVAPEPWFWEPLYPGLRLTYTQELTGAVAGPVTVTLRLALPAQQAPETPGPEIWWDGERVGSWQWNGPPEQSWSAAIATAAQDEHVLALELPGQPEGSAVMAWVDGWGVTYRRPLVPDSEGVTWRADGQGAAIPGADGARLLDISDPAAPVHLGTVRGDRIRTEPGHRYWLGVPQAAPRPARIRPVTEVDPADLEATDYLIIAPQPFWAALQPLVDLRQNQGLAVSLVTPTQVYDSFGDGRPDPAAIRSLVQRLVPHGRLRYLLLVGDATARPNGYAGETGALLVVTDLTPTTHLHETPSDEALVTDSRGRPLVAVGRFPAGTAQEVRAMVDKTIAWETAGAQSALIVSDDEPDFSRFAQEVGARLPVPARYLDAAEQDARANLLQDLDKEGAWLNYIGHGSLALLGDEKILQREDAWRRPALVTVWACLSAYFVHPEQDSLAEVWLRSPEGGAVALVGPTGETYLYEQEAFGRVFYDAIVSGKPIGDALLAAWQAAGGALEDVVRSYLLLGDPALRIHLD